MKKILISAFFLSILSIAFNSNFEVAKACTPIDRTLEERFASSTIVAEGKIIGVTSSTTSSGKDYTGIVRVDKYWKGNAGETIIIKSGSVFTCGSAFTENSENEEYLIYATNYNGTYVVNQGDVVDSKYAKDLGKGYDPIEIISTTTPATSTPINFKFNRNLAIGYSGEDVMELQTKLESLGYLKIPQGVAKGFFGQLTRKALIEYQKANNITPAAGYFGPITRQSLNK
jgi:hypothetical protein